ncbi:MAG TPA: response regulator [Actinoplanes sp.]|jgi:two-component system cell cycle response regulator
MAARILVVEDTAHNMHLMTYLLEAHGHTIVPAVTGEEAIDLATTDPPDLVLMDLQLPGIDGYQALRILRGMPEVAERPIIAITSFAMVGDRKQGLEAGFDDYLAKPIDPQTFADDIDNRLPLPLRGSPPLLTGVDEQVLSGCDVPVARGAKQIDILVLDDSRTNQALLRSVLEPYGYTVRLASTVEEAVAAVGGKCPDLVLSDIHVGVQRGNALLSYLRTVPVLALVPFAFLTATADFLDPLAREGRVRIIRRPIEPRQLLEEVALLLDPANESRVS